MVTSDYIILFVSLLPSFAWLVFYLEEDPHPEPKRIIAQVFVAGMVSTVIILGLESLFHSVVIPLGVAKYSILSLLGLAVIEETMKFGAARFIITRHLEDFDEPVDAMVYLIIAGLGFATVENIAAAFKSNNIALEITSLRFIGATLLHTISSGLIGFYWARSIMYKSKAWLYKGILYGTVLHAFFNYLILRFGSEPIVLPTTFLAICALFLLHDFEELKHYK
ncbi:MAG TPA: PrsW family glutamic-type intramembrane protease [Candidatus Paceibacterota bacterium]